MSVDIRPNPASSSAVTGGLVYKGSYNATTNSPDLTSSTKGDFYIVSVGGTLAGITLNVGDHIVFNQDASSPITSAMFDVIDNTDAVASVNGETGVVVLDTDDVSEGTTNLYYTNARFDTQLATKDTDDVSEGATNLYYTNARFDTQLATKDTDDVSEGTTNLYYTNARFDTQLATKDTDDVSEGTTNLYFTNARADARISAADMTDLSDVNYTAGAGIDGKFLKYVNANNRWEAADAPAGAVSSVNTQTGAVVLDTDDISEGTTNLYYTNARFDTQLATKDTDDVSEGATNLYFTNTRADARIAAANVGDLNDVSITSVANGEVLLYNSTSGDWENGVVPSAPVSSVNTQTGAVVLDTDDISEGTTNLYYTNARFDTQLATKTTDNLTEGATNLYYTNARFDTQLATKDTDDVSEGTTNLYYTNARFDTQLATKDTDDVSEGATNLYYTNARFDTQLATKDTDDVSEGATNLYFTNARADARIAAANVGDLNDVSITSVANGEALLYNSTSGNWENGTVSGGGGSRPTVTEITSTPYTIGTTDSSIGASELERVYLCDSGAAAVTLPTAIGNEGVKIQVKNRISSSITVSGPNPGTQQTIDGSNSVSITSQYESLTFVSDNTNWNII